MAHQNRGKLRKLIGNPIPSEIKALREKAELTEREFAKLCLYTENAAIQWETGERVMHPMIWKCYKHILGEEELKKLQ